MERSVVCDVHPRNDSGGLVEMLFQLPLQQGQLYEPVAREIAPGAHKCVAHVPDEIGIGELLLVLVALVLGESLSLSFGVKLDSDAPISSPLTA